MNWEQTIVHYYTKHQDPEAGRVLFNELSEAIELVPEPLRDRICTYVDQLLTRDSDGAGYLPWVVETLEALYK